MPPPGTNGAPIYPPGPVVTTPPPNRTGLLVAVGAIAVVGIVAVGGAAAGGAFSDNGNTPSPTYTTSQYLNGLSNGPAVDSPTSAYSPTYSPSPTPPPPPPPPPPTSQVGGVQIDSSLLNDPRAVPVATLFDAYFSGITAKNFDAVFALYDPSGDLNTNDPQQRSGFEKGVSSSTDDNGTLRSLSPDGSGPASTAEVSFQSHQAPGKGPSDDPQQTCSLWTLTYTLTYTSDGKYLIKSATGSHTGC